MSNLLESFPTLTNNLIEKSGFKINEIKINYMKNDMIRKLELTPIERNQYFLDDEYGAWTPLENNLNIDIECTIQNKNSLFNEEYGVANKNSILPCCTAPFPLYKKENIGIRNKEPNQTQLKFTELQPMADRISSCVESKIP